MFELFNGLNQTLRWVQMFRYRWDVLITVERVKIAVKGPGVSSRSPWFVFYWDVYNEAALKRFCPEGHFSSMTSKLCLSFSNGDASSMPPVWPAVIGKPESSFIRVEHMNTVEKPGAWSPPLLPLTQHTASLLRWTHTFAIQPQTHACACIMKRSSKHLARVRSARSLLEHLQQ